jgi:plastocyanin
MNALKYIAFLTVFVLLTTAPARAATEAPAPDANTAADAADTDLTELTLVIKHHEFQPAKLTAPAGKRIKIIVDNQDPTAEEFESSDLSREKVVEGNSQGVVMLGELAPGTYNFVGEFHEDTAIGSLVVK